MIGYKSGDCRDGKKISLKLLRSYVRNQKINTTNLCFTTTKYMYCVYSGYSGFCGYCLGINMRLNYVAVTKHVAQHSFAV